MIFPRSLALTALVGICASLAACEVVDDLPGDGDGGMGGETGDGDGDMGGAGGEPGTGGVAATGGQGTGGSDPLPDSCEFAESCADETILAACYAIQANFQPEIIEIAVACMNEGGCDESVTSEDCLATAYDEADLSEYEDTAYCDPSISTTCEWDTEDDAACDAKIAGIQEAAQVDFEDCLVSEEGMCDPTLCTEILR
jgi:hypothetical protein